MSFCWAQKKIFWRQTFDGSHRRLQYGGKILWKPMGTIKSFVTNIVKKYILLSSAEHRNSYRFEMTRGWVNDYIGNKDVNALIISQRQQGRRTPDSGAWAEEWAHRRCPRTACWVTVHGSGMPPAPAGAHPSVPGSTVKPWRTPQWVANFSEEGECVHNVEAFIHFKSTKLHVFLKCKPILNIDNTQTCQHKSTIELL